MPWVKSAPNPSQIDYQYKLILANEPLYMKGLKLRLNSTRTSESFDVSSSKYPSK